jgi:hypothetical protein
MCVVRVLLRHVGFVNDVVSVERSQKSSVRHRPVGDHSTRSRFCLWWLWSSAAGGVWHTGRNDTKSSVSHALSRSRVFTRARIARVSRRRRSRALTAPIAPAPRLA